jgi:hypothetical protein
MLHGGSTKVSVILHLWRWVDGWLMPRVLLMDIIIGVGVAFVFSSVATDLDF